MLSPVPFASLDRRRWLRAVAAGAVGGGSLAAAAGGKLRLRFSHVVAEETPKGLAVLRFKALVQQYSAGRIEVLDFPDAQLYGDHDEMQALQLGAVEMLAPSLSKFGRVGFPEFELFDLPFLFRDVAAVRRITQGPLGQELLKGLDRQRLVGLGYFDNGFKQMSANRPLLYPADFKGLRMRIQASRVIAAQMRALGVEPVNLGFSETRRALARGVVNGTENPVSNFWTQRMHEVQTDLTMTDHGYLGYAVVVNQRFWRSLADADRSVLELALREALAYGDQLSDSQNNKSLSELRAARTTRIHLPTATQRQQLSDAVDPVHKAFENRVGKPWMDAIRDALGT